MQRVRSGSGRVHGTVESIATVNEQNAAGAEEVSASAQEQTAGVEELSAGAQELAALAAGLHEMVDQFVLDATIQEQQALGEAAASMVPRRRASDWQPAIPAAHAGARR
jgi:hypothetical protein